MAIAVYFHPKSMTLDKFEETHRQLAEAGAAVPKGRIHHSCFGEDGDLMVYDIWESPETFEAFGQVLMPILAKVGIDPGEPSIMPLHRLNETVTRTTGARSLVERIFSEIVNEGRIDVADELFTEDYVDHGPMGDVPGRQALKENIARWREAVPDVHCTVENIAVEGDLVSWTVRTSGTHTGDALGFPPTGKHFETVSANIGRVRDGRAAEHWSEQGMLSMLQQLGVVPAMAP